MDQLDFHEVDHESWSDFASLFESRGGPKSCWCMAWRASPAEAKQRDGHSRRAAMKSRVDDSVPVGILGYLHSVPIAWCSIAPRFTYRKLGGLKEASAHERIWSLACLFIKREFRGRGFTGQLIGAAVDHAAKRGANVIEAYPVDPESPSYRFMGFVNVFAAAGFRVVGAVGQRRHIVRLDISDPVKPEDR